MRRYDLDWLRVLVFLLLILYHVGMFFVPWGWHIKNNVIYDELVYPMVFLNRWRLPILFVISGMGTFYALSKRTGKQFIFERIKRLFIPLVIGMLFIVPPQVYVERIVNAEFNGTYFEYWPSYAFKGVYPEGNLSWHHLWFLPYLLIYSLILAPLFVFIRKHPQHPIILILRKWFRRPLGLYVCLIPLYLFEAFLEPFFPVTHNLVYDWFNFVNSGFLFLLGFLLISVQDVFWETVKKGRYQFLVIGIVCFGVQLMRWLMIEDSIWVHFTEAFISVCNMWSWILTLFGFAAAHLNNKSGLLAYANRAVYPFYILHQTITLIIAYFLMDLDWGFWAKASIMVVGTFLGAWLLYELFIKRWKAIRPLFGMKVLY